MFETISVSQFIPLETWDWCWFDGWLEMWWIRRISSWLISMLIWRDHCRVNQMNPDESWWIPMNPDESGGGGEMSADGWRWTGEIGPRFSERCLAEAWGMPVSRPRPYRGRWEEFHPERGGQPTMAVWGRASRVERGVPSRANAI